MNEMNIQKIDDNYPYDLLLLADEAKEGIHKYLFESEVYVAKLSDSEAPIGVFCLYPCECKHNRNNEHCCFRTISRHWNRQPVVSRII